MLQRQIDVARSQLGSLSMSQSGYEKLKHTPSEGRSLADEVRLIMHEGMVQLKQETEASQRAEQVLSAELFICTPTGDMAKVHAVDISSLSAGFSRLSF